MYWLCDGSFEGPSIISISLLDYAIVNADVLSPLFEGSFFSFELYNNVRAFIVVLETLMNPPTI